MNWKGKFSIGAAVGFASLLAWVWLTGRGPYWAAILASLSRQSVVPRTDLVSPKGRGLRFLPDGRLELVDLGNGLTETPEGLYQDSIPTWSPDGRWVASGRPGTIKVWKGPLPAGLRPYKELHFRNGPISQIQFSSDGSLLVAALESGEIRAWKVETGQEMARFQGMDDRVICMGISPSGTSLATLEERGRLAVWDILSARKMWSMESREFRSYRLAYGADDRQLWLARLSSTSNQTALELWDAPLGRKRWETSVHGWFSDLQAFGDGSKVALLSSGKAVIVDSRTGKTRDLFCFLNKGVKFFVDPRGQRLVARDEMGNFEIRPMSVASTQVSAEALFHWAPRPPAPQATEGALWIPQDPLGQIWIRTPFGESDPSSRIQVEQTLRTIATQWSPDGMRLILSDSRGRLRVRQMEGDLAKEGPTIYPKGGAVLAMAFNGSEEILAGDASGILTKWDFKGNASSGEKKVMAGTILTLALSKDGTQWAVGGLDGGWRVGETATLAIRVSTPDEPRSPIVQVALDDDGGQLVVLASDGTASLLSLQPEVHQKWGRTERDHDNHQGIGATWVGFAGSDALILWSDNQLERWGPEATWGQPPLASIQLPVGARVFQSPGQDRLFAQVGATVYQVVLEAGTPGQLRQITPKPKEPEETEDGC